MGYIIMTISQLDGMDVDLARFADLTLQDLSVHVKCTCIPAQAFEQIIKCRMTHIFISGHQEWESDQ